MGTPFKECPACGAHLDANERCDCKADGQNETRKPRRMKLVVICREIDKETGRIVVYRVPAEIDGGCGKNRWNCGVMKRRLHK